MSMPNIPDIKPDIEIDRDQVINLLIASIAFEELGLSHIINAEAEKIQYVLGTLEKKIPETPITLDQILEINLSASEMIKNVIKTEMLLQFKLEDATKLICKICKDKTEN